MQFLHICGSSVCGSASTIKLRMAYYWVFATEKNSAYKGTCVVQIHVVQGLIIFRTYSELEPR